MKIKPFELERYFDKYEFSAPYLLCVSDCEAIALNELLDLADKETRELWDKLTLGYTESKGLPLLREEVTKLYTNIQPDQALIITPEEGIFIAMNVMLEEGDHVIVVNPSYQSLYEIADSLNCEMTMWKPNPKTWEFDVNFVKENIKPNTKAIIINFPHNPTGSQLKLDQLNELIKVARENDIYIFSDEMYRLLEFDEGDRLPSVADIYENAVSLFGVSKSFALAGLRIGWVTTRNVKLYKAMAAFKDYTTICSSAPSEVLALIALRAKETIVKRNLDIINSNLETFNEFVSRHKDKISWQPPKAGSIGFPELIGPDIYKFCEDIVKEKGVMVLPSKVYEWSGNNFRVGFGRKNFKEALVKFEEYINTIS
jgi:aspartate/methionine/tyrosine aminotransferase